jgi:superfamily I DNA/RNA helicase
MKQKTLPVCYRQYQLRQNVRSQSEGFSEYNILLHSLRTNAHSRAFEESLRRMGIAYTIYGGISFYQRKEIK